MKTAAQRTLARVFDAPTPPDLKWDAIESMLKSVGVKVKARPGDGIALVKDGEVMMVPRPRPVRLTGKATVRDIAAFLKAAGVKP